MALSSGNFNLYTSNNQFYFDTDLVAGEDMALSSGNFNLYTSNNQFYFDTDPVAGEDFEFNLTTPMSGDFGLFLNGANAISADIDIYSGGISSDSGTMPISMPLGTYVSSGVLPLYTDNRVPDSGNIDIYSRGLDSSSGNIPISFEGSVKVSGQTVNTYSFGAYLMSGVTLPTYVKGHVTFPIYSLGGDGEGPAGNIYENLPLYIGNVQASGSSLITGETMPLYIPAIPTNYSGVFPIYAMSDNGYSSGIFPIAINSRVRYSYESSMPLYFPAAVTAGVLGGEYESMPVFSMGYYGYIPVIRDTSWKISSGVFSIYTESAERAMIDL